MSELTVLIDAHLAACGHPDATRRAAVVQSIWAAGGPLMQPAS